MELKSYASDILEDAQTLAQTKAFNSFSFRDCLNLLTELWGYCYEKICLIDDGFYSTTVQLRRQLTRLPPFVRNTVKVYHAQEVIGYARQVYKEAGMRDLTGPGVFHISGNDLYCKDAERTTIWLSYTPAPPFVTFTKNNRDPKILDAEPPVQTNMRYGNYDISVSGGKYIFTSKIDGTLATDATDIFLRGAEDISAFIPNYPYIFVSYTNKNTGDYSSFIYKNALSSLEVIRYNPFDYQGMPSRVKFLKAKFNDYTGMGVTVLDQEDGLIKELGWTPDTLLVYPTRIMYNYLVSNVAKRFASINASVIPAVEEALAASRYEMGAFLKKDKSGWGRIDNVTRPTVGDYL
jgi:hypothetical protein